VRRGGRADENYALHLSLSRTRTRPNVVAQQRTRDADDEGDESDGETNEETRFIVHECFPPVFAYDAGARAARWLPPLAPQLYTARARRLFLRLALT
jgi:hypothetical protein